jgi:hypothetical protein
LDVNGSKSFDILNGLAGENGASGVYVGSGDMPPEYDVQIDIDGETIDEDSLATKEYVDSKIGDINAALLNIIAIQEGLIGGTAE